jgi:outer membrane immunogenic protein
MKTIARASVAGLTVLAAGAVNAADLPRKAPPQPPPPAFSWTGCYLGGEAGWGWGQKRYTHTEGSVSSGVDHEIAPLESDTDLNGGVIGGQIGCDYQFNGNWVIGIRGNALAANIRGHGLQVDEPLENENGTFSVRADFLASVTGRLGYSIWNNTVLPYVNGGVAWTHDKYDFSAAQELALIFQDTNPQESRTGWTIGGGVEWAFAPNWSTFVEFDYYDFGNTSHSFTISNETPRADIRQHIETLMVGLNYRFAVPLLTRY